MSPWLLWQAWVALQDARQRLLAEGFAQAAVALRSSGTRVDLQQMEKLGRALGRCARLTGDRCLVRALALCGLAHRHQLRADLRIGVTLVAGFKAHAWVEHDGHAVGESSVAAFKAFDRGLDEACAAVVRDLSG